MNAQLSASAAGGRHLCSPGLQRNRPAGPTGRRGRHTDRAPHRDRRRRGRRSLRRALREAGRGGFGPQRPSSFGLPGNDTGLRRKQGTHSAGADRGRPEGLRCASAAPYRRARSCSGPQTCTPRERGTWCRAPFWRCPPSLGRPSCLSTMRHRRQRAGSQQLLRKRGRSVGPAVQRGKSAHGQSVPCPAFSSAPRPHNASAHRPGGA